MNEWLISRLQDFIKVEHGFAFDGDHFVDVPNDNVLITPGNFKIGGGFKSDKMKYYSGPVPDSYILSDDDLIVTMTDLSKQADTLGFPALVPKNNNTTYLHNQRIGKVVFLNDRLNKYFLYYLLCSREYRNEILASSTGTSIKHTAPKRIENFSFAVPPLNEQVNIAAILKCLDDKIELNQRMNETLEAMARALFKSWFVDFDPVRAKAEGRKPEGMDTATVALFPAAFNDDGLPDGWEQTTLEKVADLNAESWGNTNHPDDVEYVDLANTKWGTIESTQNFSWDDAPSRARRILRPGDTIVGTVRPGNGSFSFIGSDGLTGSTGFAVLRPKKEIYREAVCYAVTSKDNIDRLAHLADGGAYPAVRPDVVLSTPFNFPGDKILAEYSQSTAALLDRAESNKQENRTLASLRDALLPKLISGEMRINIAQQVTNEEVAGEVLAFPKKSKKVSGEANDQFREAVLVASIVRGWGSQQYPLGNFRLQKAAYLVRRKGEHNTSAHRRHAAGPYNPDMKYRGGIGIAKKNNYVQEHTNGKFKGLVAGDAVDAINGYMPRYDFGDALAWVLREFQYKNKDELELLTTVDDAAQGLRAEGKAVDADAVIEVIRNEPKWTKKLEKPIFSKTNIERAIRELAQLFPEQGELR